MNKSISCLLLGLSVSATAAPGNDELARCAAIAAPDARLACYDTLAHRPADKIRSAAAMPPASSAPAVPATAPVVAAPATAAAAATQASAVVAPNPADPKDFGLTPAQQHTTDLGPKSIAAHISILSSNQEGKTFVVLDNGQTWNVMDNDGWLASGDAVTIKRKALGSFLMTIPSNHSYRVHRIK